MNDETEVRNLIGNWVHAIQRRDLDAVLAHHTSDIVMFDVPPPERGARGVDEYKETWPPFFEWIATGAVFEIDELDVTAGEDVAWGMALLRCGKPEDLEAIPDRRLRITVGLRKESGEWAIAHEHHSFTVRSEDL